MNPNWHPSSLEQSSATKPLTFYNFPILTVEQQLSSLEQQLAALNQQIHGSSARASQVGAGSNLFRSFLKCLVELEQMARRCNLGPHHSIRPPVSQHEAAEAVCHSPTTQMVARGIDVNLRNNSFLMAAGLFGQTPVSGRLIQRPAFPDHYSNLQYAVATISPPAWTLKAPPLLVAHETTIGGGGVQRSPVATTHNPNQNLSAVASEHNLLAILGAQPPPQGVKRKREEAERKGKWAMGAGPSNIPSDDAVEGGQNGGAPRNDGDDEDDIIMLELDLKLGCP